MTPFFSSCWRISGPHDSNDDIETRKRMDARRQARFTQAQENSCDTSSTPQRTKDSAEALREGASLSSSSLRLTAVGHKGGATVGKAFPLTRNRIVAEG